jgi:hypothetical protein
MLKGEIEIKSIRKKKLESIELTHQTLIFVAFLEIEIL